MYEFPAVLCMLVCCLSFSSELHGSKAFSEGQQQGTSHETPTDQAGTQNGDPGGDRVTETKQRAGDARVDVKPSGWVEGSGD